MYRSTKFTRPDAKARLSAAKAHERELNTPACFCAVPEGAFCPIIKPEEDDWLASHTEDWKGQTVTDFVRQPVVALPDNRVNTIELIPIGPVSDKLLELLRIYQEVFFGCKFQIGKPLRVRAVAKGMRKGAMGQLQLRCSTIFDKIKRRKVAPNVMLRVGVTMVDLFPNEDWNFVYGQANSMQGHGVFSFARYYGNNEVEFPIRYGAPEDVDKLRGDLLLPGALKPAAAALADRYGLASTAKEENPATHFSLQKMSIEIESIGTDKAAAAAASASSVATSTATASHKADAKEAKRASKVFSMFLYRCTKVLTHETGHLFGIRHCIHYECLMCGCNHREEFDRHPIHLCPVCLRKLCIKRTKGPYRIDPIARYQALAQLSMRFGWAAEVKWLHKRIETIEADSSKRQSVRSRLGGSSRLRGGKKSTGRSRRTVVNRTRKQTIKSRTSTSSIKQMTRQINRRR